MVTKAKSHHPQSLAQHFDAPEGYVGCFGWICGYSADAAFLNDAVERFTLQSRSQRAHQGRIALAVYLDPSNPSISPVDVPAVAHFPIKSIKEKPFKLLHAKVALLGFRATNSSEEEESWQLRLVVSTGNWTRQTLAESLDLAWRIDIQSDSLTSLTGDTPQNFIDIKAAWNLLEWITDKYDTRLLHAKINEQSGESSFAQEKVREWIRRCSSNARGTPRFFDNRSKSLLAQLPEMLDSQDVTQHNYLAMGSGFYESSSGVEKVPVVPSEIRESLIKKKLLGVRSTIDVFVNPNSCQAIATSFDPMKKQGFTIRPASDPLSKFDCVNGRTLHAKFLFCASLRKDPDKFTKPWIYLGSGNLTRPGFLEKASPSGGNLEAGVVFTANTVFKEGGGAIPPESVVTNLLPIQFNQEFDEASKPSAGSDMEELITLFEAPPIPWLIWHKNDQQGELSTSDPVADEIKLLNPSGEPCEGTKTTTGYVYVWRDAQPRQVLVQWIDGEQTKEAFVPVLDRFGRIAASELEQIDIDQVWWQLVDFPDIPDDDREAGGNEAKNGSDNRKKSDKSQPLNSADYPIRQMMELLENIATRQTEVNKDDWQLWCNRLEQALSQASESPPVLYFRDQLKLNPLSALRQPSFRPKFAERDNTAESNRYMEALDRIENEWKVASLLTFGKRT